MKQPIVWQVTASKYKKLYFLKPNETIIPVGGTVTKDATVHAAQQGSFITHHTVIITDWLEGKQTVREMDAHGHHSVNRSFETLSINVAGNTCGYTAWTLYLNKFSTLLTAGQHTHQCNNNYQVFIQSYNCTTELMHVY